jgi:hypothetical protein
VTPWNAVKIDMYLNPDLNESDRYAKLSREIGKMHQSKNFKADHPTGVYEADSKTGKQYELVLRNTADFSNPNKTRTVVLHKDMATGKYLEEEMGVSESRWTDASAIHSDFISQIQKRAADTGMRSQVYRNWSLYSGVRENK